MKTDAVERISFRFTRGEIAALLQLMGEKELPGANIAAKEPDDSSIESLVSGGVVMPCGEKTLVDKTIALVLHTAARAPQRIELSAESGCAVLYAGSRMCVLVRSDRTAIVHIEPIENLPAAQRPLREAAAKLGDKVQARLAGKAGTVQGNIDLLLAQLEA